MLNWDLFVREKRRFEIWRCDAVLAMQQIPDGAVDAIVTDPPYGIALKLKSKRRANSIAGDGALEARELWRRWVPEAARIAKPDSAHLIFGTWKSRWMHDLLSQHFAVKGCIAWDKRVASPYSYYLWPRWELIYLCVKGKPPRRVREIDVWSHQRIIRLRHPCEKPVELLRRAVRFVSDPGQVIFDPFCGIASTGVAAIEEGRRFAGVEIDRRFARMGLARLRAA